MYLMLPTTIVLVDIRISRIRAAVDCPTSDRPRMARLLTVLQASLGLVTTESEAKAPLSFDH